MGAKPYDFTGRCIMDATIEAKTDRRQGCAVIWKCRCKRCGQIFDENSRALLQRRHRHTCSIEDVVVPKLPPREKVPWQKTWRSAGKKSVKKIQPDEIAINEAKEFIAESRRRVW